VEFLIVTHFHADHYIGVEKLFDECVNARLLTTGALGKEQFRKVRGSDDAKPTLGALAATIERARDRGGPVWAQLGQLVIDAHGSVVRAVSPTSNAMNESDRELGLALEVGWEKVDSQLRDDNRSCVVLHLDIQGVRAMLCADLPRHDLFGWKAVLADSINESLVGVDLVKAGHHGSDTSHDDEMWAKLVKGDAVVGIAPCSSSRLPGPDDIERIRGLSAELWLAAPSDGQWIEEDGTKRSVKGTTGYFRARRRPSESGWRTEALPPGQRLHPA
jgi:beta-lactamase superfamily II metal-dependent hydrolase